MKVSKRFVERARPAIRKYQKVLESARRRDVNESDTSVIVNDMLIEILGYDRYNDITTEFAVRSTFCDLAIKCKDKLQYLVEVKPVGAELKETYLRQAIEYGAREGIEWGLLTNGVLWQAHRIRFEQPIDHDMVFEINMLSSEVKASELLSNFFLISKEAESCTAIEGYWRQRQATSRYVIAQLLLSDTSLRVVRRQLRALFPGLKILPEEIQRVLEGEIVKRDALEGDRAATAVKLVKSAHRRAARSAKKTNAASAPTLAASVGKLG